MSLVALYLWQVLTNVKEFCEKYSGMGSMLSEHKEVFTSLEAAVGDASKLRTEAALLKIEGMLMHAAKTKLKKTQRELVSQQMAEVASMDDIDEGMIQPTLLKFAHSLLQ